MLDGAKSVGATVELVHLKNLEIRECNGCHTCWKGKKCNKNDDMRDLYPKIEGSDALVLGTPVYWYLPSALMKAFIDRFVYFNCPENRAKIRGKQVGIAVPFEEEGLDTASMVVTFFEKSLAYLEMELVGEVLAPGVTLRGEVAEQEERMAEAFELGRKLVGR